MTRWRAVAGGFALAACSEALVFAVTGRVTLVGGLAGSALAGYLAGEELSDGAWHGLLTAMAWGIVLIPGLVALSVVTDAPLPFPIEFLLPLLDTPGEATTTILLSASLPNVAAGVLGSLTRRQDDGSTGQSSDRSGEQSTARPTARPVETETDEG
ncbi:DUF5518 domain-containing protein [Halobellus rufus]|uniref:DUF5518 domain-containing protein n=1 Tax=Halobellus rufus TaxID=1448860 RepID=UPI0018CC8667|nr:DUF5518 domain-containing protein [Halobellus rufus]